MFGPEHDHVIRLGLLLGSSALVIAAIAIGFTLGRLL